MDYTILIDNREQQNWLDESWKTAHVTLETGDYSIAQSSSLQSKYTDKDLNHFLCLERKKTVSELAQNLTKSAFKKEIERLANFKHKFLILEFSYTDVVNYPYNSSIPRSRWRKIRVRAPFILACLSGMMIHSNIQVIFAENRAGAIAIASEIIKRCIKILEKKENG